MNLLNGSKKVVMKSASFSKLFKDSNSERAPRIRAILVAALTLLAICCQPTAADRSVQILNQPASNKNLDQLGGAASSVSQQQHDPRSNGPVANGALEAELNSIIQQHDALDINNKQLAEAIISRLMMDNLSGSNLMSGSNELENDLAAEIQSGEPLVQEQAPDIAIVSEQATVGPMGPEASRLRKLMNALHNYESAMANGGGMNGGLALIPYPILQSSQAATMKRAAMKMGNLLQQQQRQSVSPFARNNFDFGLGKRPDSTVSNNILRYGDVSMGGQIQPLSQFGKRPSSHRYDFGLGKRVASPAYPRYDFGLGKRAPSRVRYDFGLGK